MTGSQKPVVPMAFESTGIFGRRKCIRRAVSVLGAANIVAFWDALAGRARAQENIDARAQRMRREFIEVYGEPGALQEFDHPSKTMLAYGGPITVFLLTFNKACLDLQAGGVYKAPTPPKLPSKLWLFIVSALPNWSELVALRARSEQAKMIAESEEQYDRGAKTSLTTAKKLVEMFGDSTAAQLFDSMSWLDKTAALFDAATRIIDGQAIPSPYILYLCDSGGARGRGRFAREFVADAFGSNDSRAANWPLLDNAGKYQAVHDALRKFFSDGAAALRGTDADLQSYESAFFRGKSIPPTDRLILMAFGREAREHYRSADASATEKETMRKAALVTYAGWAYMFLTLFGEPRDPRAVAPNQ